MKSRLLMIIGIMIAVSSLFTIAYFTNEGLDVERCTNDTVYKDFTGEIVLREICVFPFTGKTITDTFLGCDETFTYNGTHCITKNVPNHFTETEIPLGISDEDLKSKAYITNCDETLHKEELPDLTIENSTHNYDMQYCKWELKYPDLTSITNENLLNGSPYCAELFDTLFAYYQSIRDDCGMQRYNEDGTPRGVCEPAPAGARVPYDDNMIKSGCSDHYADWAYQTKHNDDVFYLFN